MTLIALDPTQGPSSGELVPAKRLTTFANKRLGLLWNNRPGGDWLLKHIAQALDEKYHLAETCFTMKMFIGNAAAPEIIDDLVARVDAVIVGVGD